MTASQINNGLYWLLARQSYQIQIPNYTPLRWWESDHYAVTKAGFAVEFEIKTSVADFKADATKQRDGAAMKTVGSWVYIRDEHGNIMYHAGEKKHDQLASRSIHGPSRFYFVCPEGLLQVEDMPEWAGLIWAYDRPTNGYPACCEQKSAPKLHREKAPEGTLENIRAAFYYRYWTLRQKMKVMPDIAEHAPPPDGFISEDRLENATLP
jgi:hypothetical protein